MPAPLTYELHTKKNKKCKPSGHGAHLHSSGLMLRSIRLGQDTCLRVSRLSDDIPHVSANKKKQMGDIVGTHPRHIFEALRTKAEGSPLERR